MTRNKFIVGIASLVAAAAASVAALQPGKAEDKSGKCYPTEDGKFVCKASGDVMDSPCCDRPCCK